METIEILSTSRHSAICSDIMVRLIEEDFHHLMFDMEGA
jgi:hypothetical protein